MNEAKPFLSDRVGHDATASDDVDQVHGARSKVADRFTRDKFAWLDRLAIDTRISDAAFRLAYLLASLYLNRKTGEAFPGQERLGVDLGKDERQVRRLIAELSALGLIEKQRGGRGRPNRYRPVLDRTKASDEGTRSRTETSDQAGDNRTRMPTQSELTGQILPNDRTKACRMTGQKLPPNPLKEPNDEPTEKIDSRNRFEEFWKTYPRKVSKAAAQRSFDRIISKHVATGDELLLGAQRYADERLDQDPRYTKHATTWLNGHCWLDERSDNFRGHHVPAVLAALTYGDEPS